VLGWSARGAQVDFVELFTSAGNMAEFAKGFLRPEFADWQDFGREMLITIQIAIWGTFLAVLCSVPCGLMCAENLSPWWVRHPLRRLMDAFRAINEMIFAMLFITAVGLGPFAGVLALFVHTLGTLSKLFSEAVEAIDARPVEGIRASGAGALDEIVYGVLPQVMPLWVSYTLYRFEANVRSASVVGMVGAGGIGMLLWDAIRAFEYGRTSAMLIVIIITVTLLDYASYAIRKRFT
jgi:phosphonate transport system permease protein